MPVSRYAATPSGGYRIMNIRSWLREHGLEEYADAFAENEVDAGLLPELCNEDLMDLGITRLADRKRLLKAIERLSDDGGRIEPENSYLESSAGERRQVTVLFADLAGFTELSTKLDLEDMHDLLTRFYEVVDGIVEHYGGAVDKHLGDGVMALFGAPRAHGDDPVRAVRAAFDIHEGMNALSSELKRNLSVHVGIASGEVIAGGLGRDGHKEYTVIGDSVNLASRLDALANSGETMIDEIVQRAVTGHVEYDPVGEVQIKGLDAPVKVWRARCLLSAGAGIGRSTFVGRRSELRQFEAALEMSGKVSHGFTGARIMSALALGLDEPKAKCDALDEGERMLEAGSVSHNHFFFYPDAIEVSLDIGDWDGAERYAAALEDFTKTEPLPWSNFFIARGRALAAWGRSRRDSELMAEIQRLCHEAEHANIATALPALEEALIAT